MKFLEQHRGDPATGLACCLHCDSPLISDAFLANIGGEEAEDGEPFGALLCMPDGENKFKAHFVMICKNDGGDGMYHRRMPRFHA